MNILKRFWEIFLGCIIIFIGVGGFLLSGTSPLLIVAATGHWSWVFLYIPLIPTLITVSEIIFDGQGGI